MDAWNRRQTEGRYDRNVRYARLSVAPHTPARRLAFTIEEALRLTTLPGENEGRSYYFRSLRITNLPGDGNRRIWLEKFHRTLEEQTVKAIHGSDPRAASANAIFFHGETEGLEILLHRILAHRAITEWFWPMVTAQTGASQSVFVGRSASPDGLLVDIVEKLRDRPASWVAVAAALFATPGFDVARLLGAIPPTVAEGWLSEMGASERYVDRVALGISPIALSAIHQAVHIFGVQSTRTLWLATLAVLADSPADLAAGRAFSRANVVLQRFVSEEQSRAPEAQLSVARPTSKPDLPVPAMPSASASTEICAAPAASMRYELNPGISPVAQAVPPALPAFMEYERELALASETELVPIAQDSLPIPASIEFLPTTGADMAPRTRIADATAAPALTSLESKAPERRTPDATSLPVNTSLDPAASLAIDTRSLARWNCIGQATSAAGFFFLLNSLHRIGITQALAAGLSQAGPDFLPQLLLRLAAHAGVPQDDPVWVWLKSLLTVTDCADGRLRCDASCWPSSLQPSRDAVTVDYISRVWYLAVRRWCWRVARINVTDIVSRPGVFSVNRTDLDISLPLDETDIRIRQAGLDLDPGWIPWFGRVVRFHYLYREEFHG